MDFVKSHFGKMQFWIVEHFHLHKKVPVVHMIFFKCYDSLVQVPFCEGESVQLFRVAFFRSDFFQNPYFTKKIALQYVQCTFKLILLLKKGARGWDLNFCWFWSFRVCPFFLWYHLPVVITLFKFILGRPQILAPPLLLSHPPNRFLAHTDFPTFLVCNWKQ